ncbi:hypothetical protein BROUX41_006635 [Berkeleyomyces rouxiae]
MPAENSALAVAPDKPRRQSDDVDIFGFAFELELDSPPPFPTKKKIKSQLDLLEPEPQGSRCFVSKLLALVESLKIECGIDSSDEDGTATNSDSECKYKSNFSLCAKPLYTSTTPPIDIMNSNRQLRAGVSKPRHSAVPTTTIPFGLLRRLNSKDKDPPSVRPVYKPSPPREDDQSGPWLYGVTAAPPNTVPWLTSKPPPVCKVTKLDVHPRPQDLYFEPPRPTLHSNPAVHKMLAGDRDAGSFIIGSPGRARPHFAATCDLRDSNEARAYFEAYYKRASPPRRHVSPTWTASDFPKRKVEKRNPEAKPNTSTLTELLRRSCTDHAICVYLRAFEHLKMMCTDIKKESARSRETMQVVASQLRELEIAHPTLEQTVTQVTTTTQEDSSEDTEEAQRQKLRHAVEAFLDQCGQVERKAVVVVENLGQTELLRKNIVNKLKTEDRAGHDTSANHARELLLRVVDSAFLDEELHRLAIDALSRLKELEECHTGDSQTRVAAMIHSVLENYM